MYEVDTSKPVMVTGATGFVAGWLVKRLLESGATVHAPVRNPDNALRSGNFVSYRSCAHRSLWALFVRITYDARCIQTTRLLRFFSVRV